MGIGLGELNATQHMEFFFFCEIPNYATVALRLYHFDFMFTLQDAGDPPLSSSNQLIIQVQDVDDMPPRFSHTQYIAEVIGEKPVQVW